MKRNDQRDMNCDFELFLKCFAFSCTDVPRKHLFIIHFSSLLILVHGVLSE